ncbi:toxin-antitoxin system YwqK family antitoxin [Catalinimonas niigatensis]|uniref:hypothetical protein n=1 Tax=Catalinimonas niigatensis TaxID=1397264 RepID=UPI0026668BF5|nr:hypothetical protein [Catalinimonas niigatensis]WPP48913.1 hypothetical protein PZB72_19800 [Catalinimonas niigatensis]
MKKELFIFLAIIAFPSFLQAQIEVDFKFFDSCQDSVILLNYELYGGDTTILSTKNIATVNSKGYYSLSVAIERNGLTCYKDYLLMINDNYRADTLYLNKLTLCNNGTLHAEDNYYYNCGKKCEGVKIEKDETQTVRTRGKFVNGWPVGKLRYYDEKGYLTATEIHRNGKLIKIR